MHPDCRRCGADLPAHAPGAFICSLECTFCAACAEALDDRCPECSGELVDRPTRGKKLQADFPPSTKRIFEGDVERGTRPLTRSASGQPKRLVLSLPNRAL